MNALPRRSARLSQLHQTQASNTDLSSTSQSSSLSSSSFPSPANDYNQQQDQLRLQIQSQYLTAPQQSNAPLPSPSATDFNPFFSYSHPQQASYQMPQQPQQTAQQTHQQHNRTSTDKNQQRHGLEHQNSFSSQQPALQMTNASNQLPPDFLAEAARRAQIACLMRDMGDVTL